MARYFEFNPPNKRVTEIRVHGVGGTPPDAMLDDPHPAQVSGDDHAGFFRKTSQDEDREVEAYSWGGLTSRSKARVLWLLLLPFSLVNVAGWMVESDTSKDREDRQPHAEIQERTIRVVGALVTLALVGWIAALTVDLVAFQCGGRAACREGHWWLGWIGDKKVFAEHPGLLVGLGLIPPLLVFAAIDLLAKRVRTNYDDYRADPSATGGHEAGDMANLGNREFWNRPSLVRDLAWLHRACVLFALASAYAFTLDTLESAPARSTLFYAGCALAACSAASALGAAVLRPNRRPHDDDIGKPWLQVLATILGGTALIALAVYAWRGASGFELGFEGGSVELPPADGQETPRLAAFRRLPFVVLGAQMVLLLAGVVIPQVWWWSREIRSNRRKSGSRESERTPLERWWATLLLLLCVAMVVVPHPLVLAATALCAAVILASARHRVPEPRSLLPASWQGWAAAAVTVGVLVALWVSGNETPALVALAAAAVVWSVRATEDTWPADVFRWGGIAVVPFFGVFLLTGVFAGLAIRLRDFLDKDAESAISLELATAYRWFAIAFASAVTLTALAAFMVRRRAARVARALEIPTPDFSEDERPERRRPLPKAKLASARSSLEKSIVMVRTARSGDILVTCLTALTVLGIGIGMRIALTGSSEEEGWNRLFGNDANYPFMAGWGWLVTTSSWLLAALPLALLWAVRRAAQDEATRRTIGIVWDLTTFWPRRFHPFAPPSYAERAVPELQQRIEEARRAKAGTGSVALLGHSQGSILSLAALASLESNALKRVAFVSYGSPLGTFYRRFFPSYFTPKIFDEVASKLKDADAGVVWKNFYRWTDPIGGPVFATVLNDPPYDPPHGPAPPPTPRDESPSGLDVHLYDPWWWWDTVGQPPPWPLGHSTYLADEKMREWTETLWSPRGGST